MEYSESVYKEIDKEINKEILQKKSGYGQAAKTIQTAKMAGNQAVIQRMFTMKTRSQDAAATGHSLEWQRSKRLLEGGPYGRNQLYPFSFETSPVSGTPCSCAGCTANADTWDHKTPLTSMFNDKWPESLAYEFRKQQFYNTSNLQPMCRSCNSSKGGGGYDQRYATACMVYQTLGEKTEYREILVAYGDETIEARDVLSFLN